MLKIGSLKLRSNLILAPMAGVSDLPFRLLNRRFGCELAFVEMINVRSLSVKSKKTNSLLATEKADRPLGLQLLAGEELYLRRAIDVVHRNYSFDIVDFNAACPARKVTRRGEGASLMREPEKLYRLLKILVDEFEVPVTVKIRSGWDKAHLNAREVALRCQDAGAKAVFIHGRTRMQEYSGTVDYEAIRQVKKALSVPVIGSGDVLSPQLAKKMLDETGCDGLLVARGSFGNPWIFRDVKDFLKDGTLHPRPGAEETVDVMEEHYRACIEFYGPGISVSIFRKFFAWSTKGFKAVRQLREKANTVRTAEMMLQVIEECRGLKTQPH